ncbi:hypothetical protein [Lentzea sp. NBRC 102530]|uniref:hypothetical protein n=1 Tax=Lentzea sp. NBRC 102530 TaxID=3032201 RepID=UPI002553D92C|nr:hypothetical protein [Lentzea sp. NBRC 102530]
MPAHLMSRTQLGDLDLPRDPSGQAVVAVVKTSNWRGKKDEVELYDVHRCPPTRASGKHLESAAARGGDRRTCQRCGAQCQRSLAPEPPAHRSDGVEVEAGPLVCPACRFVIKLQRKQDELAAARPKHAARAVEVLAWERLAALWVDEVVPPPTPSGAARKTTAVRVQACDVDGKELVDVTVRLVGERAKFVPSGAIAPEEAVPVLHAALLGRPLVAWDGDVLLRLYQLATHETLPHSPPEQELVDGQRKSVSFEERKRRLGLQVPHAVMAKRVQEWRGQLGLKSLELEPSVPPGSPDRLLYLLRRMAATAVVDEAAVVDEEGQGASTHAVEEQLA